MPDLLLELFSEEIPARMQPKAAEDLRRLVTDGLVERGLSYAHAAAFATPAPPDAGDRGPRRALARPARGAQGPARRRPRGRDRGLPPRHRPHRDQLEIRPDKKGEVLFAVLDRPGRDGGGDRRRDRRGGGPRLPLAEVDALGRRLAALGAPAARRSSASSSARPAPRSCPSRSTASPPATPPAATASTPPTPSPSPPSTTTPRSSSAPRHPRPRRARRPHRPRRRASSPSPRASSSSRTPASSPRTPASPNGR